MSGILAWLKGLPLVFIVTLVYTEYGWLTLGEVGPHGDFIIPLIISILPFDDHVSTPLKDGLTVQ